MRVTAEREFDDLKQEKEPQNKRKQTEKCDKNLRKRKEAFVSKKKMEALHLQLQFYTELPRHYSRSQSQGKVRENTILR